MILSTAQIRALRTAAHRASHFLCPVPGVHAASETALLGALRRKGLITADPSPRLTEDGLRAARETLVE